jgi:hypothetical protein
MGIHSADNLNMMLKPDPIVLLIRAVDQVLEQELEDPNSPDRVLLEQLVGLGLG